MKFFRNSTDSVIWRYYAFTFFTNLHFFAAVLVPFFTDWGGISKTQVQFLQSWFMLWLFFLEIPTGAVADYFGRKTSMVLGTLMFMCGALIYGSFPRFEVFLIGEFIFALSIAFMSGAEEALVYDSLKEAGREEESKQIFGNAHSIQLFALLISAPIGSLIASTFSMNMPLLLTSIPIGLGFLTMLTVKEPKIHDKTSEQTRYLHIVKEGMKFFYTHKTLRLIALDGILVASAAYFVVWLYQPLLQLIGIEIKYFGFIHMILVGAQIIVASNFVRIEKWLGSAKAYLTFTAIMVALAFVLVGLLPNIYTTTLFLIIAGGFGLTRLKLMNTYMNRLIPSEQRATVLSSINMFRRLGLVIINPLIGLAADQSLQIALLLVSLLPLAVFFFSPLKKGMLE